MDIDVGSLVPEFFGQGFRVARRQGRCLGRFEEMGIAIPRGQIAVGNLERPYLHATWGSGMICP